MTIISITSTIKCVCINMRLFPGHAGSGSDSHVMNYA